jgi:hypothetical protein
MNGRINGSQSPPPSHGFFSYLHTSIRGQKNFMTGFGGATTGAYSGVQHRKA